MNRSSGSDGKSTWTRCSQKEDEDTEKRKAMIIKRRHIVTEILTTEKSYVTDLGVINKQVLQPLKLDAKQSKKPLLNLSDIVEIFSNIEHIWGIHIKLLDALTQRVQAYNDLTMVGDVLANSASEMNMYHYYIDNYYNSRNRINMEMEKKTPDVEKQFPSGRTFDSYLIVPVQRIPRYILLVQDLLNNTSPNHPDRGTLQQALYNFKEVADLLNNKRKSEENLIVMRNLCKGILNFPNQLLTSHVNILMRSTLWESNTKTVSKIYLVLFNRFLVLSSILDEKKGQFRFLACLALTHLDVVADPTNPSTPMLILKPDQTGSGPVPHIFSPEIVDSYMQGIKFTHPDRAKLKLWWFALYKCIKEEIGRMSKLEAVGVNSEQIKSKDLTRTKIIRDFLKKDMEYIRLLKSFEKLLHCSEEEPTISAILSPLLEPTKFLVATHNVMLSALAERFSEHQEKKPILIGDIFCSHVRKLKHYESIVIYSQTVLSELNVALQVKTTRAFFQHLLESFRNDYDFYLDDMLDRMEKKIVSIYGFLEETLQNTREDHPDFSDTFQAVSEYNILNERIAQLQQHQRSKKVKK